MVCDDLENPGSFTLPVLRMGVSFTKLRNAQSSSNFILDLFRKLQQIIRTHPGERLLARTLLDRIT